MIRKEREGRDEGHEEKEGVKRKGMAGKKGSEEEKEQEKRFKPLITMSSHLNDHQNPLYVDNVKGFDKAPLVHSDGLLSVFSSGQQGASGSSDVTLDQLLPISLLGSDYVTFPSLPLSPSSVDTFTIVAVFNGTIVTVFGLDPGSESRVIVLEQAGDVHDLDLPAAGFHHMTSTKPFYVYGRLGGSGGICTVTLLPVTLWSTRYTLQVVEPYTLLGDVYVALIGKAGKTEETLVFSLSSIFSDITKECGVVTASNYSACYFQVPSHQSSYTIQAMAGSTFAAYMFARHSNPTAGLCHQLGTATSFEGQFVNFDAAAYVQTLKEEALDLGPCPEMSTVMNFTTELTTQLDTTQAETSSANEQTTQSETSGPVEKTTQAAKTNKPIEQTTQSETGGPVEKTTQAAEISSPVEQTTGSEIGGSGGKTTQAAEINKPTEQTTGSGLGGPPEETTKTETDGFSGQTTQNEAPISSEKTTQSENQPVIDGQTTQNTAGTPKPTPEIPQTVTTQPTNVDVTESLPPCIPGGVYSNLSTEAIKEMAANISQALRVDKTSISKTRRKKESSPDNRTSSVSLGVLGLTLISFAVGLVIVLDINVLFTCVSELRDSA
ncbi:hypothetical protein PoB_001179700 [Plakobranchus ocellatus]|uniref:IgGFc-binding protein N-terminal domain-containing protein n=1 Tax=Plakobranchus ocellatus TaxID=259542 RepID=A0AAV3YQT7_9GAST|nr:hypothetical protein PoB_001179700 [Plakobranchus ocellatus]